MSNSKPKIISGYKLQEKLGSGSFATVYKATTLTPSKPQTVAIKAISKTSSKITPKLLSNLEMEITMLSSFRHQNIVCMYSVEKTSSKIYLILEYCAGGDLQGLIRSRERGRLSEGLVRRLVRDLSEGLRYLWGKSVIHRDIKPQNLLLTGMLPLDERNDVSKSPQEEEKRVKANFPTREFFLKIADFGFARHLTTTSLAETLCGSPLYMAPEILQHHRYDAKADLWSVGAVIFEMLAGHPPFSGQNHIDLLRNIQRKAVKLPRGVSVSPEAVGLLKVLLNRNPLSRAGFDLFFEKAEEFIGLGCNPNDENDIPVPTLPVETAITFALSPSPITSHAIPPIPEQPEESDFVMVPSMLQTIKTQNTHTLLSTSPNTGAALLQAINSNANLEDYTKLLAAAQDIGRRAVNIAHVGDARAFLAMNLIQQQIIDPFQPLYTLEEEDEDMPFALTESKPKEDMTDNKNTITIHQYLQEALSCYLKALTLLKSALKASQQLSDQLTFQYLTSQFQQVLERADAANIQMSKLPKLSTQPIITSPEQLIYTHALAAGKHGAVKQLLGQNEAAKESYHTAALLTESLLMDTSKYPLKDTIVLQEYVTAFATRIREIEKLPSEEKEEVGVGGKPSLFESLIPPLPFVTKKLT